MHQPPLAERADHGAKRMPAGVSQYSWPEPSVRARRSIDAVILELAQGAPSARRGEISGTPRWMSLKP